MGKLKTFYLTLIRTFTDLSYYHELTGARLSFSLKYFLMFFVVYGIVATIFLAVKFGPTIATYVEKAPYVMTKIYPENLVVSVANGEVSTNMNGPVIVTMEAIAQQFDGLGELDDSGVKNLIVIDTEASPENFRDYQTGILVTRKSIVTRSENGDRIEPIDTSVSQVIDRNKINDWASEVTPYVDRIVPFLVLIAGVGIALGMMTYYFMYVLFLALLIWGLSRLMKKDLSYGASYRWGLHLVTISATLMGLSILWGLPIRLPMLQTAFLLIVGYLVLKRMIKRPASRH